MYDEATINRNIRRIKAVPRSDASMPFREDGALSADDQAATEAWRQRALGFWNAQKRRVSNNGQEREE